MWYFQNNGTFFDLIAGLKRTSMKNVCEKQFLTKSFKKFIKFILKYSEWFEVIFQPNFYIIL